MIATDSNGRETMATTTLDTETVIIEQREGDDAIPAHKVDGPLAAALLAAGVGSFVLGLFTTIAAANTTFNGKLSFDDGVGPLSGKTIWAVIFYLVSWAILAVLLKNRDGVLRQATIGFIALTALGFLMTFPTFFEQFH